MTILKSVDSDGYTRFIRSNSQGVLNIGDTGFRNYIGDIYKIHNHHQCSITGGNLVAINNLGAEISSIFPTAFVQVLKSSSSSATQLLPQSSADTAAISNATMKKMLPFILG